MPAGISAESTWRRSRIVVPVTSPAAGVDWQVGPPSGHVWRVLAIGATLLTSAAAATRSARLSFTNGDVPFLDIVASATHIASLTRRYVWLPVGAAYAAGSGIVSTIPETFLQAGWTIGTITDLIDVGDQWSSIFLSVIDTTVRSGPTDLDTLPDLIVEVVENGPGR